MEFAAVFKRPIFLVLAMLLAVSALTFLLQISDAADIPAPTVAATGKNSAILLDHFGTIRETAAEISGQKAIPVAGSSIAAVTWKETAEDGSEQPFYALSLDGNKISVVPATYDLRLRYGQFDPLYSIPRTSAELSSNTLGGDGEDAYIVQFVTQPLEEYRTAIRSLGGKVFIYLPDHAHIVKMDAEARERVAALPFVRWVGNYRPAYKLEEELLTGLAAQSLKPARYNIMMLDRGPQMQDAVAERITELGGSTHLRIPQGFRIEATLSPEQLAEIVKNPDVMFIDRWSAPENDMDVVRTVGGGNFIETTYGMRGEGVRAEVMDNGLRQTHNDFNSGNAPLIHNSPDTNEPSPHGTSTYGINFGRGTANAAGRGMLPEAQGIFADYNHLTNRYDHTARLLEAPYFAVYQSNSWGGGLTVQYNSTSAETDDVLFKSEIVLLNSQSNNGNRSSRPQAWAKNVVSIGGVRHYNTAGFNDDRWGNGASIGPAADGRLKPELAHFYDSVYTTTRTSDTAYTSSFGGTSAATPITAGHFGLFFQMWHNGLFGNPVSNSVFNSRPKMSTAKAVMINTAVQWDMTISGTDITRNVQGFGRADLTNLYNLRNKMKIVNETDTLTNLQTRAYPVTVAAGSTVPLKVTMVYTDPMGSPAATRARINDLTLKVTAPNGTVYWGNNGLQTGMWSTSGGSANVVDTVENVFIQSPAAGLWVIEVIASEINQDGKSETPAIDADFALVASGISPLAPTAAAVSISGRVATHDGRGIRNARVRIDIPDGTTLTALTGPFGYFKFDGVPAGTTCTLSVAAKRFTFAQPQVSVPVNDNITDIFFAAETD